MDFFACGFIVVNCRTEDTYSYPLNVRMSLIDKPFNPSLLEVWGCISQALLVSDVYY